MPVIEAAVEPSAEGYGANREAMIALISEFRTLERRVREKSASKVEKYRKRDQLLPRERVAALLDSGVYHTFCATPPGFCRSWNALLQRTVGDTSPAAQRRRELKVCQPGGLPAELRDALPPKVARRAMYIPSVGAMADAMYEARGAYRNAENFFSLTRAFLQRQN